MNRRDFLGGLVGSMGSSAALGQDETPLRAAARDAWLYCLPLMETANVRAHSEAFAPGSSGGEAVNAFVHYRALATPDERLITSPNVDTLYSMAFIDLKGGAATITWPATGKRYFSLHLMDMYSDSFMVCGGRREGGSGSTLVIVGPSGPQPNGAIRAPTSWVWALVRIGTAGPHDLEEPHAIQQGLAVRAGPAREVPSVTTRDAPWDAFFADAARLLAETPPLGTDGAMLDRLALLDLGPARRFDPATFRGDQRAQDIRNGVADARVLLANPTPEKDIDGWRYAGVDLGNFKQNYLQRARVAVGGLGALPRPEAMYMRAVAPDGRVRFRGGQWRLTFQRDQHPPVEAFWSLTVYEATPQGQFFLIDNPLHRYAIGDRTEDLVLDTDGALTIWIGSRDPGGGKTGNWLPAPNDRPFVLSMRAYLPGPALLSGSYRLPPVMTA